MFIVEIESGTWLAPWSGDPGRTYVRDNAKKFKTKDSASKALDKAKEMPWRNGFPHAEIHEI